LKGDDPVLTHPTLDLLHDLGLHGMAKGFKALEQATEARALEHAEWLGLLLEHEATLRRQKRFEARAKTARLRHNASVEDIDYRTARGLDRALFLKLAACDFIRERRSLLITGPCGVGKSWLACALGHKACRQDFSVLYHRTPRLFAALALARGDGRYAKLLRTLARVDLLILDDWDRSNSTPNSAAIFWRSSRTATMRVPSSSPVSCRSRNGTRSSAISYGQNIKMVGTSAVIPLRVSSPKLVPDCLRQSRSPRDRTAKWASSEPSPHITISGFVIPTE